MREWQTPPSKQERKAGEETMGGHILFVVLHLIALLFGAWALVITIPLHLIYGAVSGNKPAPRLTADPEAPSPLTHVRCPDCRELVRADAVKCKHCGTALVAADMQRMLDDAKREKRNQDDNEFKARMIIIGIIVVIAVAFFAMRK
jgi:hypothetical protein